MTFADHLPATTIFLPVFCVCVCIVPKLLCAIFCYVMRNPIRIHFSAGQGLEDWHVFLFCCHHPPAPVVLSLSLRSRLLSVSPPPLYRPPHACQANMLSVSLCAYT